MKSPIRKALAVLIVLISSPLNLAAQVTRRFRPDDMFQARRIGATVWAGDGRYATIEFSKASRWLDGVPANDLSLLDVRTRSLRQLSPRSPAYLGFFNAAWSPDSSLGRANARCRALYRQQYRRISPLAVGWRRPSIYFVA